MQHRRLIAALLIAPALLAGGCKKKKPVDDGTDGNVMVQDVGSRISVVSIDPSSGPADKSFDATIRGGGFANGARVAIGARDVGAATFLSSGSLGATIPALPAGRYDVTVTNPDGAAATLRGGLNIGSSTGDTCDAAIVYFDTDKSDVKSGEGSKLDRTAPCYAGASAPVRVEGHADERGTTDYNLALGERRAQSVKRYLVNKGVPADRVSTLSYGEERPAASGTDEAAWAQNRRAEVALGR